jgi:hypothetical protein
VCPIQYKFESIEFSRMSVLPPSPPPLRANGMKRGVVMDRRSRPDFFQRGPHFPELVNKDREVPKQAVEASEAEQPTIIFTRQPLMSIPTLARPSCLEQNLVASG